MLIFVYDSDTLSNMTCVPSEMCIKSYSSAISYCPEYGGQI